MMPKTSRFSKDIELDARMVLVATAGGQEGLVAWAFMHRGTFSGPDEALARAVWLKRQGKAYIEAVSVRAAQLEAASN
jgi:hypothetical protein